MVRTIDMQSMRYLNLFRKITHIDTKHVFPYNEMIYFCVPKQLLSKALGKEAHNLKRISNVIKKRVRIIPVPKGAHHSKDFIQAIVNPVQIKEVEVSEKEIVVTAGNRQTKAALLGRNKRRLEEMKKIILAYFNRDFRVA